MIKPEHPSTPAYTDMFYFGPTREGGERGSFCHVYSESLGQLVQQKPRENGDAISRIMELRSLQYGCVTNDQEREFKEITRSEHSDLRDYEQALEGRAHLASGLGYTLLAFPAVEFDKRANTSVTFIRPEEHRSFEDMLFTARATFKGVFNRLDEVGTDIRLAEPRNLANGTVWHPIFDFGINPNNQRGFVRTPGQSVSERTTPEETPMVWPIQGISIEWPSDDPNAQ